jgi:hypothetical protein
MASPERGPERGLRVPDDGLSRNNLTMPSYGILNPYMQFYLDNLLTTLPTPGTVLLYIFLMVSSVALQ